MTELNGSPTFLESGQHKSVVNKFFNLIYAKMYMPLLFVSVFFMLSYVLFSGIHIILYNRLFKNSSLFKTLHRIKTCTVAFFSYIFKVPITDYKTCLALQTDALQGKHGYIEINNMKIHYVEKGTGPLIILIHGFPESWFTWSSQLTHLSKTNRVIAFDIPGYNNSTAPKKYQDYTADNICLLLHKFFILISRGSKFSIAAHDWGGIIAFHYAQRYPQQIDRMVLLNTLYPALYKKNMTLKQFVKSHYMYSMLIPLIEYTLMFDMCVFIRECYRRGRDVATKDSLVDVYRHAMFNGTSCCGHQIDEKSSKFIKSHSRRDSGYDQESEEIKVKKIEKRESKKSNSWATVQYYKQLLFNGWDAPVSADLIMIPTLLIWGENDFVLDFATCVDGMTSIFGPKLLKIMRLSDAGHFVHLDKPEVVNSLMHSFINKK